MLTFRAVLLLLLAAPILALGAWLAPLEWAGWGYLLLALALLALDARWAGSLKRFQVQRQHDSKLNLGVYNSILVKVYNRGRRPAALWLRDEAPPGFEVECDNECCAPVLQGEAPPLGEWIAEYRVRPLRRGDHRFGDLNLRWRGPLGLVVRQGRLPAAGPVKVYPNMLDIRRYDLLLRRNRLQEIGLRHTRMFGEGTEYERLREYLPDDDFRRIDWKATARRNRPVTVEYQTERSQNIILALDTGRMMQSPVGARSWQDQPGGRKEQIISMAKLDYVVNAALFLAYVATGKGDRVGMLSFADQVSHFLSPEQGRGQFYRMLELLYGIQSQPVEPDYGKALSYLALKQRKRALIVIFTDLSAGYSMQSLVGQVALLARSSLPLVVTISEPDISAAARQVPSDSLEAYRRVTAGQLLEQRQAALDSLRRQGVLTLDVPANQLSTAVINRYLELKGATRL